MGERAEREAFVTLATNDTYALGCLVLANSIRQTKTTRKLVVMLTDGVTFSMRHQLERVFDILYDVDLLDSQDSCNLALLGRPDLSCTFTKLHCWKLTQFDKAVFLDADTLVLQGIDELFDREELSASPDAGWPDCFNSGVFVFKPSEETYAALRDFALAQGSFDGGDQGLLNLYFRDWATKDIARHLPFIYNVVSQAFYSYLPAFTQFKNDIKIVHFIGQVKPWHHSFNTTTGQVQLLPGTGHDQNFLQLWWNLFIKHVQPALDPTVSVETVLTPFIRNTSAQTPMSTPHQGSSTYQIMYPYVPPSLDDITYTSSDSSPSHSPSYTHDSSSSNFISESSDTTKQLAPHQISAAPSQIIEITDSQKPYLFLETHYAEEPISHIDPEAIPKSLYEACDLESSLKQDSGEDERNSDAEGQTSTAEDVKLNESSKPFTDSLGSVESKEVGGLVGELASLQIKSGGPSVVFLDDADRRLAWERGQMDYMGVDSFENIQRKLDSKIENRSPSPATSRQVLLENGSQVVNDAQIETFAQEIVATAIENVVGTSDTKNITGEPESVSVGGSSVFIKDEPSTDVSTASSAQETDTTTESLLSSFPTVDNNLSVSVPSTDETTSFSLPSVDESASFSLPAAEESASFTLPTADENVSFSLPAADESSSFILPAADESATFTLSEADESASFSLPAADESASFTLPAADESASFTLPAEDESASFTLPAADESASFTLPAAEETASFTLPEAGDSATFTLSSDNAADSTVDANVTLDASVSIPSASDKVVEPKTKASKFGSKFGSQFAAPKEETKPKFFLGQKPSDPKAKPISHTIGSKTSEAAKSSESSSKPQLVEDASKTTKKLSTKLEDSVSKGAEETKPASKFGGGLKSSPLAAKFGGATTTTAPTKTFGAGSLSKTSKPGTTTTASAPQTTTAIEAKSPSSISKPDDKPSPSPKTPEKPAPETKPSPFGARGGGWKPKTDQEPKPSPFGARVGGSSFGAGLKSTAPSTPATAPKPAVAPKVEPPKPEPTPPKPEPTKPAPGVAAPRPGGRGPVDKSTPVSSPPPEQPVTNTTEVVQKETTTPSAPQ